MKRRMVTFRETKNGRDRTAPMTEPLHTLFAGLPRQKTSTTALVLPPYEQPKALTRGFTRHAQRVGLRGLTFHDLRHDAASTLTMAGVSRRAIVERLGHRDPRMTIRYRHLAPDHLRDALRELEHAVVTMMDAPSAAAR